MPDNMLNSCMLLLFIVLVGLDARLLAIHPWYLFQREMVGAPRIVYLRFLAEHSKHLGNMTSNEPHKVRSLESHSHNNSHGQKDRGVPPQWGMGGWGKSFSNTTYGISDQPHQIMCIKRYIEVRIWAYQDRIRDIIDYLVMLSTFIHITSPSPASLRYLRYIQL